MKTSFLTCALLCLQTCSTVNTSLLPVSHYNTEPIFLLTLIVKSQAKKTNNSHTQIQFIFQDKLGQSCKFHLRKNILNVWFYGFLLYRAKKNL